VEVLYQRCAALDIGKDEVVACTRVPADAGGGRRQQVRTYKTFTAGLEALADWLAAEARVPQLIRVLGYGWG
jgi:transposase